eukprot:273834-Chlamydomonas_euryale.AAC.6
MHRVPGSLVAGVCWLLVSAHARALAPSHARRLPPCSSKHVVQQIGPARRAPWQLDCGELRRIQAYYVHERGQRRASCWERWSCVCGGVCVRERETEEGKAENQEHLVGSMHVHVHGIMQHALLHRACGELIPALAMVVQQKFCYEG